MDLRLSSLALATLLRNQTSAQTRVSPTFDHTRGFPQISFETVGDQPMRGYSPGSLWRVAIRCHGPANEVGLEAARKLYSDVRSVLLPANDPNDGYYGTVTVTFEGTPRTVYFSGIAYNAGPNELQDPPTGTPMLESFWIAPHWEVV